jgi:hypothetical protein
MSVRCLVGVAPSLDGGSDCHADEAHADSRKQAAHSFVRTAMRMMTEMAPSKAYSGVYLRVIGS